jgi:hypothetical protein
MPIKPKWPGSGRRAAAFGSETKHNCRRRRRQ